MSSVRLISPGWKWMSGIVLVAVLWAGFSGLRRTLDTEGPADNGAGKSVLGPRARGRGPDRSNRGTVGTAEIEAELFADAVRADPDEVLERARRESGSDRSARLIAAAQALAETRPEEAAAILQDEVPAGAPRDAAWQVVIREWSARDPEKAAGFVEKLTPDGLRSTLLLPLLGAWPDHQREKAIAWLGSLPADSFRDQAADALASRLSKVDAADVSWWLGAVPSAEIQARLREALAAGH